MKTLVLGATGATGKHLVDKLVKSGQQVKVIVRSTASIPETWENNSQISIIESELTKISTDEMAKYLEDCDAVASCLGHRLTLRGIWGKPRRLVTDSVKVACKAIVQNDMNKPIKFVLMNTSGNVNRDREEKVSFLQNLVLHLLRIFLPPQADNEEAANFLRLAIGQNNPNIEWVAVRPDTLINEESVTEYSVHLSPTRSALFNPGKTSRINVGNFMARLITEQELWEKWKGQMPVIYNETEPSK